MWKRFRLNKSTVSHLLIHTSNLTIFCFLSVMLWRLELELWAGLELVSDLWNHSKSNHIALFHESNFDKCQLNNRFWTFCIRVFVVFVTVTGILGSLSLKTQFLRCLMQQFMTSYRHLLGWCSHMRDFKSFTPIIITLHSIVWPGFLFFLNRLVKSKIL